MGRMDYLKLRGRTYYVIVQIPRRQWRAAGGKRAYVKTLKTRDLDEAERRKHSYVAEFKRRIKQLEDHGEDPDRELFEKALAFKDAMQHGWVGGGFETPAEFYLSEALDEAKAIVEEHGEETADRFMRVVKGEATFIRDHYTLWLDETRPKPKQRDAHSKAQGDTRLPGMGGASDHR